MPKAQDHVYSLLLDATLRSPCNVVEGVKMVVNSKFSLSSRLSPEVFHMEFEMGKVELQQVYFRTTPISLSFLFHQMLHFFHHTRGWFSGPFVVQVLRNHITAQQ